MDIATLPDGASVSHINLNDGTCAGLLLPTEKVGSPGRVRTCHTPCADLLTDIDKQQPFALSRPGRSAGVRGASAADASCGAESSNH